jgi:hypothetical protein
VSPDLLPTPDDLHSWVGQLASHIAQSKALNSNFVTSLTGSLIGAAAGAWAGAYAVQKIADRAKRREELKLQHRHTNAAITFSVSICEKLLSLKQQHLLKLNAQFVILRGTVNWINEAQASDHRFRPNEPIEFPIDLSLITPLRTPIEPLQKIVFENITPIARVLSLVSSLNSTIDALNNAIIQRNTLTERMSGSSGAELMRRAFALPDRDGNTDAKYAETMDCIYSYCEDSLAFSVFLIEDLKKHGENVCDVYLKEFRQKLPRIWGANFEKAERNGLFPPREAYADWMDHFFQRPRPKTALDRERLRFRYTRRKFGRIILYLYRWSSLTLGQFWLFFQYLWRKIGTTVRHLSKRSYALLHSIWLRIRYFRRNMPE